MYVLQIYKEIYNLTVVTSREEVKEKGFEGVIKEDFAARRINFARNNSHVLPV